MPPAERFTPAVLGAAFLEVDCLAMIFFAAAVVRTDFLAEVLAAAAVRLAALSERPTVLPSATRIFVDVPGFGVAGVAFGRETLISPRIERPGGRAFAGFTVGRFVGLLRGVDAMGTTLGTVDA